MRDLKGMGVRGQPAVIQGKEHGAPQQPGMRGLECMGVEGRGISQL